MAGSTAPTMPPAPTPGREDFRKGQKVGLEVKHLRSQVGAITRINQRTASIDTGDGLLWKVSLDCCATYWTCDRPRVPGGRCQRIPACIENLLTISSPEAG